MTAATAEKGERGRTNSYLGKVRDAERTALTIAKVTRLEGRSRLEQPLCEESFSVERTSAQSTLHVSLKGGTGFKFQLCGQFQKATDAQTRAPAKQQPVRCQRRPGPLLRRL